MKKILVLGLGAQGLAAARKLDQEPNVSEVICAGRSREAVDNVVSMLKKGHGVVLDANDKDSIAAAAKGVDLILNALPLEHTKNVLDAALEVGVNYQDYAATTSLHEDWVESIRIQYDVYGPKFAAIGRLGACGYRLGAGPDLCGDPGCSSLCGPLRNNIQLYLGRSGSQTISAVLVVSGDGAP